MTNMLHEIKKPIFDGTISFGHILTALSMFISLMVTGVYAVQKNTELAYKIAQIETTVPTLKADVATLLTGADINAERITNLVANNRSFREDWNAQVNELRRIDNQFSTELNITKVDVASIKSARKDN